MNEEQLQYTWPSNVNVFILQNPCMFTQPTSATTSPGRNSQHRDHISWKLAQEELSLSSFMGIKIAYFKNISFQVIQFSAEWFHQFPLHSLSPLLMFLTKLFSNASPTRQQGLYQNPLLQWRWNGLFLYLPIIVTWATLWLNSSKSLLLALFVYDKCWLLKVRISSLWIFQKILYQYFSDIFGYSDWYSGFSGYWNILGWHFIYVFVLFNCPSQIQGKWFNSINGMGQPINSTRELAF